MNTEPHVILKAEAELSRIEVAAQRIFEESPILGEISALIAYSRREIDEAVSQRGVESTVISILGAKDSGKSWLCRSLVSHQQSKGLIGVGFGSRNATEKLTWIGAEAPEHLNPEFETRVKTPPNGLVDLGRPYVLLDVPGFDDGSEAARSAARNCLALAPLRVFIATWDRLGDESAFRFLNESNGTNILPVIVDPEYPRPSGDYDLVLSEFMGRLQRHCPLSVVSPPVIIPSVDLSNDPAATEQKAILKLHGELRDFVGTRHSAPPRIVSARMGIFKLRLRGILGSFFERVEPHYRKLNQAEDAALSKILDQLLGGENTLKAGVRMRLLMETVRTVPVGFFPYRILLTTMTLAAGAIDRLILAFSGNLPSLAITAFQASRNLQHLQQMRANAGKALRERAEQMAGDELAEANDIFLRAIEQEINLSEHTRIRAAAREIHLTGIGLIESRSAKIFEESLSRHASGPWLPWSLGGLATLSFFGLAAAPAWAVYNEFFKAWRASFHDSAPSIWQDFPAPSGSMIFATLLLMTVPVVILALVTVVLAVTPSRAKRCVAAIINAHEKMRDELLRSRSIRITTKDPVREAVSTLLDACPTNRDVSSGEGAISMVSIPAHPEN